MGHLNWSAEEFRNFGKRNQLIHHNLHELEIFSESTLQDVLHDYPRERLQAFTMGSDPSRRTEWEPVEVGRLAGAELLRGVQGGRLWLNVLRLDSFDSAYRDLLDSIYADLERECPNLEPVGSQAHLLISSPDAQVYYHADATFHMLWHIRGEKRIWVYPVNDPQFAPPELLEDIFASVCDEEIPYEPRFDERADTYLLRAGDAISWPHNAPHRIVNQGSVNVSLSTTHISDHTERRKQIFIANRFLRRRLGIRNPSTQESGAAAFAKQFAFRVCARAGLTRCLRRKPYVASKRIDSNAPGGLSPLPEVQRTSFSV